MPLPGRAVLLLWSPHPIFVSCPSPASPPRPFHQSTATAPPSCGEDPVSVSAKLHRISPPTPPAYPAPPRRGKRRARAPKSQPKREKESVAAHGGAQAAVSLQKDSSRASIGVLGCDCNHPGP